MNAKVVIIAPRDAWVPERTTNAEWNSAATRVGETPRVTRGDDGYFASRHSRSRSVF